ncbi:hypothetical protein ACIA5G_49750 [Amycolatopsis sp. NPDC051758]|uniref:hypothetical protein n=1 Tax=Amycolatopsis sp. NPDC051758 TaxID=3363935 RepID=UPI0037884F8C
MAHNPPPATPPSQSRAHLEAHLICARTCQAAAQGWLIDGISITFSSHRLAEGEHLSVQPGQDSAVELPSAGFVISVET